MISFKHCLTPEDAQSLQNKVVECVTKTSSQHPLFGKISRWQGALNDEYFLITFSSGVVMVSVVEREHYLGESIRSYAESQSLLDTVESVKNADPQLQREIQKHYTNVTAVKEQEEVTFADMMFILNWKYVEGARVDESDMLEA